MSSEPFMADNVQETDKLITDPLPILYRDEHLVAVNKPPGLLVHRSWIDKEATQFAMQMVRDQLGQYVYPVHRLDKPTSGVLLMALSKDTAALLMPQFAEHRVQKRYWAIVRGHIHGQYHLDYPLKEESDKMTDRRVANDKPAQEAITDYRGIAHTEIDHSTGRYPTSRYSLLELLPKTGRKHQLRRHMHHISHPIIGDTTHGDGRHNTLFRQLNLPGLWLWANQMTLTHPISGEQISIDSPISSKWQQAFDSLGLAPDCSI